MKFFIIIILVSCGSAPSKNINITFDLDDVKYCKKTKVVHKRITFFNSNINSIIRRSAKYGDTVFFNNKGKEITKGIVFDCKQTLFVETTSITY